MRLICDANVLLSAILGRRHRPKQLLRNGAQLLAVDFAVGEVVSVLSRLEPDSVLVQQAVETASTGIAIVDGNSLLPLEGIARSRLHVRGQPDWPTLAAAIELDAGVWSDDRDYFGVGVPVWSTWTLDRHPILTGTA